MKYKFLFKSRKNSGFTLIEIVIVIGMSLMLFGLITINLIRFQGNTSSQSNINILISDLKSQQLKSMLGSTEGRNANDSYGVYFLANEYILFHGATYDQNDSDNFSINLPEDVQIESTTFPNNTIVFSKLSGEISGFTDGANTVTVRAVNINKNFVITFNRYGVITGVN